jgi:hypothetical protein
MPRKRKAPRPPAEGRQIVGFSLPRDLAAEVKMEAARRGVSLKELFTEIWALHRSSPKKSA